MSGWPRRGGWHEGRVHARLPAAGTHAPSGRRSRSLTPAERAAISADQAEALKGVIDAVLDGIGLSGEQRQRAIEIAAVALRRVAGEDSG